MPFWPQVRVSAVSSLMPPGGRHGRRASAFERLALDAAAEACARWADDAAMLMSVFATHSGDAPAVDRLLDSVILPLPAVSPMTFLQSVTCTLAGSWTSRHTNHAASSTVTAGPFTPGAALLEAASVAVAEQRPCLLVVVEVPPPSPLGMPWHVTVPCAIAAVLSPISACSAGAAIELVVTADGAGSPCVDASALRTALEAHTPTMMAVSPTSSIVVRATSAC